METGTLFLLSPSDGTFVSHVDHFDTCIHLY